MRFTIDKTWLDLDDSGDEQNVIGRKWFVWAYADAGATQLSFHGFNSGGTQIDLIGAITDFPQQPTRKFVKL